MQIISSHRIKFYLTWDRVALIINLIVSYDIDFALCIQDKIHERAFCKFTTLLIPYLVQILCDDAGVSSIPYANNRFETTRMADVGLIKDDANPIALYRTQPLTSSSVPNLRGLLFYMIKLRGWHWVPILILVARG